MNQKARGFTIIETILVFAIAGLIFLMAFVALPSLWASQRDTDRRALVTDFVATLKKYQTNNSRGALPTGTVDPAKALSSFSSAGTNDTTWAGFVKNYLKKDYLDPESKSLSENYLYVAQCGTSSLAVNAACNVGQFGTKNKTDAVPKVDKTTYVAIGAKCDGNQARKSANNRDAAVFYMLERGGRYCVNI